MTEQKQVKEYLPPDVFKTVRDYLGQLPPNLPVEQLYFWDDDSSVNPGWRDLLRSLITKDRKAVISLIGIGYRAGGQTIEEIQTARYTGIDTSTKVVIRQERKEALRKLFTPDSV